MISFYTFKEQLFTEQSNSDEDQDNGEVQCTPSEESPTKHTTPKEELQLSYSQCYGSEFGSESTGSTCFWASGSGSFYQQAKIVRKTLIPTVL